MSGERQTVAGAYAKIQGHEELCAERYKNIHGRLDLLFAALGVAIMLVIGAGGWAMAQIYSGQAQQLAALQQVAARIPALPAARSP